MCNQRCGRRPLFRIGCSLQHYSRPIVYVLCLVNAQKGIQQLIGLTPTCTAMGGHIEIVVKFANIYRFRNLLYSSLVHN